MFLLRCPAQGNLRGHFFLVDDDPIIITGDSSFPQLWRLMWNSVPSDGDACGRACMLRRLPALTAFREE